MSKSRIFIPITKREREVLNLIAEENSNTEIAQRLALSKHTVESHRKNLMGKLDAKKGVGLIRKAYETGLLKPINRN